MGEHGYGSEPVGRQEVLAVMGDLLAALVKTQRYPHQGCQPRTRQATNCAALATHPPEWGQGSESDPWRPGAAPPRWAERPCSRHPALREGLVLSPVLNALWEVWNGDSVSGGHGS